MARPLMSSVSAPNPDVKKIRLYRNGDVNFGGKDLVFNRRQVKTIDRLLQTATEHVDLGRAARSLHTPRNGTLVRNLDEIGDKESYVLVGQGSKFRPANYGMLYDRHAPRTMDRRRQQAELEPIKVVEHSPIRVPGRMHQSVVDVIPIYVYCNGEDQDPPKRLLLTDNMFRQQNARRSWEMILAEISRHVQPQFTATTQLYTLDGTPVKHRSEITPGKEFVAVGYKAPFKHMNYAMAGTKPVFNVSPRIIRRNLTNGMEPYYRQGKHGRANYSSDEDSSSYIDSSSMPPMSTQSDPVIQKNRPYRYDYKVVYTDGRNVFPSKTASRPIKYQEPLPAIADDRDDVGVFKSRTARLEANGAKEVEDNEPKSSRRYVDNKKLRTSRMEADGAKEIDDEEQTYERRYAEINGRRPGNNKAKVSRAEMENVDENEHPAYVETPRASPKKKTSRMEMEDETRDINDEEPMSDAERHHGDDHRNAVEDKAVQNDADVNNDQTTAREQETVGAAVDDDRVPDEEDASNRQDDNSEREAATRIQAAYKGYSTRKRLRETAARKHSDEREAATRIQAAYKGYSTRKRLRDAQQLDDAEFSIRDADHVDDEAAATTAVVDDN